MVSALMMTGALGLFLWELDRGAGIERARTIAVSAVVMAEMWYLLNSRYILRPVFSREGLFGNSYVWMVIGACALLQLAYVHTTPLQAVFHSTDLSLAEWGRVLLVGLFVFTVAETEKAIVRRMSRQQASPQAVHSDTASFPSQREHHR